MNEEVDQQAEAMLKQEVFRWIAVARTVESASEELQAELAESGLEDQIESVLKSRRKLMLFINADQRFARKSSVWMPIGCD